MSDRVKDEQHPPRIVPAVTTGAEHQRVNSYGIGVRIDPAHTFPPEAEARDVDWQKLDHFVTRPPESVAASPPPPVVDPSRLDTLFVDQVSQLARPFLNQIQSQKLALEQREQELRVRIAEFDEEQQRFFHQAAHDQSQQDSRRSQLQKNEAALAERLIAFEVQSRKFEAEIHSLQQQRADVERQKKSLRDEILSQLQTERTALDKAKLELQQDLDRAQTLKDALQQRLESVATENQRTLQAEREKLWQSLTAEWEQRKVTFQQEHEIWTRTRELEKSEIERERAMFESAVSSANAEFLQARETLATELNELREQHARELAADQLAWKQQQEREEAERTEFAQIQAHATAGRTRRHGCRIRRPAYRAERRAQKRDADLGAEPPPRRRYLAAKSNSRGTRAYV